MGEYSFQRTAYGTPLVVGVRTVKTESFGHDVRGKTEGTVYDTVEHLLPERRIYLHGGAFGGLVEFLVEIVRFKGNELRLVLVLLNGNVHDCTSVLVALENVKALAYLVGIVFVVNGVAVLVYAKGAPFLVDEHPGNEEVVPDVPVIHVVQALVNGQVGYHLVVDWPRVLPLSVHGKPQYLPTVVLDAARCLNLRHDNLLVRVERVYFLHIVFRDPYIPPLPRLVAGPVGMDVDVHDLPVKGLLLKPARLEWHVGKLHDVTKHIVVHMEGKTMIECHIPRNETVYVVNGFLRPVADVFGKAGIIQPIPLDECLVTLATGASYRAALYEVEHPLGIQVIPAIRLNVERIQVVCLYSFWGALYIVYVHKGNGLKGLF